MSKVSPLVDSLIEAFQCLPGVGPKSAQRMALHLLERNKKRNRRERENERTESLVAKNP